MAPARRTIDALGTTLRPFRVLPQLAALGAIVPGVAVGLAGGCSEHGSTVRGSDILQPVTNEVNAAAAVVQTTANVAALPVQGAAALLNAATAPSAPPPPSTPGQMISQARALALKLQSGERTVASLTQDERVLLIEVGKIRQQERERQRGR